MKSSSEVEITAELQIQISVSKRDKMMEENHREIENKHFHSKAKNGIKAFHKNKSTLLNQSNVGSQFPLFRCSSWIHKSRVPVSSSGNIPPNSSRNEQVGTT